MQHGNRPCFPSNYETELKRCWAAQNSFQHCGKTESDQGNTLLITDLLQCTGSAFTPSPTCGCTPGPHHQGKLHKHLLWHGEGLRGGTQTVLQEEEWNVMTVSIKKTFFHLGHFWNKTMFIQSWVSQFHTSITHLITLKRLMAETGKLWAENTSSSLAVLGDYSGKIKEWNKRVSKKEKASTKVCHL